MKHLQVASRQKMKFHQYKSRDIETTIEFEVSNALHAAIFLVHELLVFAQHVSNDCLAPAHTHNSFSEVHVHTSLSISLFEFYVPE